MGTEGAGNIWTFTGHLSDADHDPTGWTVTLSSVLDGTTTVQPDGTFEYSEELSPQTSGNAVAQTEDDLGTPSNRATFPVGTP